MHPATMTSRPSSKPFRWLFAGLCVASAAASYAAPPTAENATPAWTPTGWSGGGFYFSAAYHPTRDGVLFLGMDVAGVAKSTDHGKTFRMVNKGLVDYGMYSLAVDTQNPDIAYAGTEGGLHKSTDGGETWNWIPNTGKKELRLTSERNKSIRSVAPDPSDSNIVYAASPSGKVYKSTDGAATWRVAYEKPAGEVDATPGVRAQFGKVNGAYFGGLWTSLKFPAGATAATGIGLTLKGDGSLPERAFINLRTGAIFYRSRNINEVFSLVSPTDFVLTAADFELDPEWIKKNPDKVAAAPKTPDWSAITRMDLSRVAAPDGASMLILGRVFVVANDASGKAGNLTVRDFVADKKVQSYGNIRFVDPAAGPASGTVFSVVVSTRRPARVLACTEDSGLLLSDDKGETWKPLPTPTQARHAAFDPANPDIIYGVFGADGVRKSTDKGATWTDISKGLAPKFIAREIIVSPANSNDLHLIGSAGWNGGYYHSNDGGATWTSSTRLATDPVFSPTLPGEGRHVTLSTPTNITINPLNPKQLYISANWRPVWSGDGGKTWEERVAGADITVQTDIRFSGDRVYVAAMDEGTLMSEDQGKSWKQLWPLKYEAELSGHNWRTVVTNINGVDRIISTASPWNGKNSVVIVISEDGGKTFKTTTAGLPTYRISANTMWGRGYPRALAVDPTDPKIVYLGIDGDPTPGNPAQTGGGLFKSEDGGHTWKQLPNQPGSRRMYYGLAIDPTNPKRLVWGACNTGGGVYVSEDGGETWAHTLKQDTWIFNVHATADGTLYAGGNNLWRSTDGGKTWKKLTNLTGYSVVGIEVDSRDPKTMWISAVTWDGSSRGSVYKTTDGGASWTDFTGDLQHRKPQILRFNPKTNELWSGQTVMHKIKQ